MCGIAGIISGKGVTEEAIGAATAQVKHRGPEADGYWKNNAGSVVFGHRRLCIIDPTGAAAQPMHYLGRYTIIYNGEVYNYIELRQRLQQEGFLFHSASDTEVVVSAYAAYGEACLQHFDGMFAFAIWDEKEQVLFAARDRFGEKPFFFFYDGQQMVFASEIKALWALGIKKEVNPGMLYNFLTIGYTGNPSDPQETFYKNVQKLPAASFLRFHPKRNRLSIEKYWLPYVDVNNQITEQDAAEQFSALFGESVRRRLRSDVAIGTSLSGGLDSSAVVAFCDQHTSDHYTHKCFTAGFDGSEKDETAYASIVAKQYGLSHFVTSLPAAEVVALMERVSFYQDEPFASASVLAQYKVYESAKEHGVTVLLDGQGADEILAGYHKYYKWYWQELYGKSRKAAGYELRAARALGINEPFGLKNKLAARLPQFAADLLESRKEKQAFKHPDLNSDFAFAQKRNLYYATPSGFDLNGALYYNTFVNGLEELLRLADRNSMAHSTEVRLPFLSHQLVEFLFTLPPHLKIRDGWTKWLLRKSVEKKLPAEIVWRRDKIGFEPPQKQWMAESQVQHAIHEAKRKLVEAGILKKEALAKVIIARDAHEANSFDWRYWSASYLFAAD